MMSKDNPDTMMMDEQSHWESTHVDDVFLPSVRVQLGWADVETAVDRGAIVPTQAHALWASWALPGSATRVGASMRQPDAPDVDEPGLESSWNRKPAESEPAATDGGSVLIQVIALLVAAGVGAALTLVALSAF